VKDVIAYLRLILNPTDDLAFLRVVNVPARGIGAKGLAEIQAIAARDGVPLLKAIRTWADGTGRGRSGGRDFAALVERFTDLAKTLDPGELVTQLVEQSGIGPELRAEDSDEANGRLENLEELARASESDLAAGDDTGTTPLEPLDRLLAFVDRASLAGQDEELPEDAGAREDGRATLLTAHLAKGLEFPVVFVSGMYEGGFPHFRSLDREEDIEEERRLVYVAFTRAKERLFITRPRRRLAGGEGYVDVDPSRFLGEIPRDVLVTSVTAERAGYTPPASLVRPPPPRGARPFRIDPGRPQAPREPVARRPPPAPPERIDDERQGSLPLKRFQPPPFPVAGGKAERTERAGGLEEGARTWVPDDPSAFQPGTRVYHPTFGAGIVKRREGSPANLKLDIQFEVHGRKTLLARFADLEIIV
jgi:DNA helicase II / ATP-dependent DNA helicase PcrA